LSPKHRATGLCQLLPGDLKSKARRYGMSPFADGERRFRMPPAVAGGIPPSGVGFLQYFSGTTGRLGPPYALWGRRLLSSETRNCRAALYSVLAHFRCNLDGFGILEL